MSKPDNTVRLRRPKGTSTPRSAVSLGRFAFLCLLVLAMCAVFVVETIDAHRHARQDAMRTVRNLSTAIALDLSRNVELLDLSLQAVVDAWGDDEIRALKPALRNKVLFDHSVSAAYLGPILVLDQFGSLLATSDHAAPTLDNYAGREFFEVHVADAALGLFVSRPFKEADGWSLAFSRRLAKADGTFAGIVVGTLHLSYLQNAYRHITLGEGGVLSLFSTGGVLVARDPIDERSIGKTVLSLPAGALNGEEAGAADGKFSLDGVDRIYGYQRVGALPLVQFAAISTQTVFADFWRRTTIIGGVLAALSAGVFALVLSLRWEFKTRVAAEAQLARLVLKDELTGLLNRRAFNDVLDREWRLAVEQGAWIGLLMVDADHFKSFNDANGHPAGDAALRTIAAAIATVAERHEAPACRYGGEEFAVLLPDTPGSSAYDIAEDLRRAIHDIGQPHRGSPHGRITVSVGVAALCPGGSLPATRLVDAADAALYAAKGSAETGRRWRRWIVARWRETSDTEDGPSRLDRSPGLPHEWLERSRARRDGSVESRRWDRRRLG